LLATPSPVRIVLASAVMGLAASIKLSGITLGLPLVLAVLVLDLSFVRKLPLLAASGLAALLTYYTQYALGQRLTGLPASPAGVVDATMVLVRHHAALTQMTNPFTSHWYTWFIPSKPIMLRYDVIDGVWVRAMTMLGNPLLWWSSAVVVAGTLGSALLQGGRALLGAGGPSHEVVTGFLRSRWPSILPLAGFLGFLSPWVLTSRDSYIYHYLPSYGFGLVLLAGAAAHVGQRFPRALLLAALLVGEVSVFYAPVWAQLPLSADSLVLRLFLPTWR
jgi:dolichyl-phosphate-mannose--protein O-mannosyl transferase